MKLLGVALLVTRLRTVLIVFHILLLAGCVNFNFEGPFTISNVVCPPAGCLTTVPINIEDKHVFLPALRASINLGDDTKVATVPHTGHAIEFGYTSAKGYGSQSISTGEQIYLNSQFAGPQQIKSSFDFIFTDILYRWRRFYLENNFGLELLGGFGYPSLNLKVSSPTQNASGSFSDLGLQGGFGLIWRLRPGTNLLGRVTLLDRGNGSGVWHVQRNELTFAQALSKNLTIHIGYAKWTVKGTSEETGGIDAIPSDFNLRFSGPTLRLDWDLDARNLMSHTQPEGENHLDQGVNSF